MMKVLVVGSGGREHALVWKIAQSPKVGKIYAAPGNGGMAALAECLPLNADDIWGLKDFAREARIDLTIVGPEAPLVKGMVDEFSEAGLKVFGPGRELAQLEGSKVFAKEAMARFKIPTAEFAVFDRAQDALKYIAQVGAPIVIKADGLAAGKGVIVAGGIGEAQDAVKMLMEDKKFGEAGERIVIEEALVGEEASIIVFSDGENVIPLASSQDHKRIGSGDTGPNTGGMGAYSPAPVINDEMQERVMDEVIHPLISGLAREGRPYQGMLYAGIMVGEEGPKALEFNVRFGDPETQAILPRLKDDLVEIMEKTIEGSLNKATLAWDDEPCVSVVLSSGGYPGEYKKGFPVSGIKEAEELPGVVVFHSGTKRDDRGTIFTSGGRVLGVTAKAGDIRSAISRAYEAVGKIHFEGLYCRDDIGRRALAR